MVKIAFWDNCLNERGTTVAIYDYAYYNKHLLGNESIILYDENSSNNNNVVIDKFKAEFDVFPINNWDRVDDILIDQDCDILYIIKYGKNDGKISGIIKTVVHCVFVANEPHGNIYASIAKNILGNNDRFPVVPHMINLPKHSLNMRNQLNIPENATVFGRHGGKTTFDLKFVQNIVFQFARNNPHIYFLFLNTDPFCDPLPNIIHIPEIIDLKDKVKFINTCDAMIWGRNSGESFGLSIGEFSINNKPVIATTHPSWDNTHYEILKDKGIWYNEQNLYNILETFNREKSILSDWNAYNDYLPENVMKIFESVFIN
jgi:hypothetical protein